MPVSITRLSVINSLLSCCNFIAAWQTGHINSSVFLFGDYMNNRGKNWDIDFFMFLGVIAVFAIIWAVFG